MNLFFDELNRYNDTEKLQRYVERIYPSHLSKHTRKTLCTRIYFDEDHKTELFAVEYKYKSSNSSEKIVFDSEGRLNYNLKLKSYSPFYFIVNGETGFSAYKRSDICKVCIKKQYPNYQITTIVDMLRGNFYLNNSFTYDNSMVLGANINVNSHFFENSTLKLSKLDFGLYLKNYNFQFIYNYFDQLLTTMTCIPITKQLYFNVASKTLLNEVDSYNYITGNAGLIIGSTLNTEKWKCEVYYNILSKKWILSNKVCVNPRLTVGVDMSLILSPLEPTKTNFQIGIDYNM